MKESIKSIVIGILFISTIYFAFKCYSNKGNSIPEMSKNITLDSAFGVTPLKEYRDKDSIQHVVIDERTNKMIENEAALKAKELQPAINAIAQNLGIQSKQVESSTTISTEISQDSIDALNHTIDSLTHKEVYDYRDKNLTLTFNRDSFAKGQFGFSYDADLNINQYWQRNKVLGLRLGSKVSYTDISSNDPRVTIKGIKKFIVKQKEPSYGGRIQLRSAYNDITKTFSFGPAARVDIDPIKGSFAGSYLYNTQTKTWGLSLTFDKDLIRF